MGCGFGGLKNRYFVVPKWFLTGSEVVLCGSEVVPFGTFWFRSGTGEIPSADFDKLSPAEADPT
jgi:hypothetical protein